MRAINGFENVQAYTVQEKLPAGAYKTKIVGAKVVKYDGKNGKPNFEKLEVAVDITDGEYADYFKQKFDNDTATDKKWKGVLRMTVPTGDGSDSDNKTMRIFKSFTNALEDSNANYHWDWDETKLKGKKIGILVRDKQYSFDNNGKHYEGFAPEIFGSLSTSAVDEGKYKTPAPKLLEGMATSVQSNYNSPEPTSTSDEYPFF